MRRSHAFPISLILEFPRYADGILCPRAQDHPSAATQPSLIFRDSDWPGLRFDGSGDVDLGFAAPILVSIHASFFFFILVLLSARGYIFSFGVLGNFLSA